MKPGTALQLYTLRSEAAADFEGVLRRVAAIGYAGVETAGLHDMTPERFRSVVDDCGINVCSSHTALPVGDRAAEILDNQQAIGSRVMVSGGRPDDFSSTANVRRLADRFNEAAQNAGARGMVVGYHNHYWEFNRLDGGSGGVAYDLLAELLDPSVLLEVDIYWVQVADLDPSKVVEKHAERARLLHVKDGPLEPPSPMTALGKGRVDLKGTLAAAPNAEWHIVELDECATDMMQAVEESYAYLVSAGLA